MNTRDNLLYLIESSYINSTIIADSFPEVPDFGAYLRNASSYLAIYDHLDKLLLSPKRTVQSYYQPLLRRQLQGVGMTNVNFFSFIALAKSFYYESQRLKEFTQIYPIISKTSNAFISLVAPEVNKTVYWTMSNNIAFGITQSQTHGYSTSVLIALVLMFMGILLNILRRMKRCRGSSIELLQSIKVRQVESRIQELSFKLTILDQLIDEGRQTSFPIIQSSNRWETEREEKDMLAFL